MVEIMDKGSGCACDDPTKKCGCDSCAKKRKRKRKSLSMIKSDSFSAAYQAVMDMAAKKTSGTPCGRGWTGNHPNCKRKAKGNAAPGAPAPGPAPGAKKPAAPAPAPAPAAPAAKKTRAKKAAAPGGAAPAPAPGAAKAKKSAEELARDISEQYKTKPRTLKQQFGPNPTSQQVTQHKEQVAKYNNERRRLINAHKKQIEAENAARAAGKTPAPGAPEKGGALVAPGGKLATTAKQPAAGGEQEQQQQKTEPRAKATRWERQFYGRTLNDAELQTFVTRKAEELSDAEKLKDNPDFRAMKWREVGGEGMSSEMSLLVSAHKMGITSDKDLDNDLLMAEYGKAQIENYVKTFAPGKDGKYRSYGMTVEEHEKNVEKVKNSKGATPRKIANAEKQLESARQSEELEKKRYAEWSAKLADTANYANEGRADIDRSMAFEANAAARDFKEDSKAYGERAAVMMNVNATLTREQGLQEDLDTAFGFKERIKDVKQFVKDKKELKKNIDKEATKQLKKALGRLQGGKAMEKDSDMLGLDPTADLTAADLKAAYRKAAAKAHPDAGGNADQFRAVNEAYERLKKTVNDSMEAPYRLDDLFKRCSYARAYRYAYKRGEKVA